jgi:hypothetical protein
MAHYNGQRRRLPTLKAPLTSSANPKAVKAMIDIILGSIDRLIHFPEAGCVG